VKYRVSSSNSEFTKSLIGTPSGTMFILLSVVRIKEAWRSIFPDSKMS
jgi:hypothetical protein